MYRSALVALKPGSSNDVASRYAVALAQQKQLQLVGMAVIDADRLVPAEAVPLGGAAFKAKKDEALLERARQAANDTLSAFCERSKAAGIECEGLAREGQLSAVIATAVQRTDLLIVGHRVGQDIGDVASAGSALHEILKRCPRPAIVVPAFGAPTHHVLLAYDGSMQAARAVQAFVSSGLYADHRIHVLCIQDDPAAAEGLAEIAGDYLRRHGRVVESLPEASQESLGPQILAAAHRMRADLLVMGAYGKSSLQEFLFGSVTRAILNTIDIPLFLDH